ncbi:MAG: PEP-CTERM sorting domain-containing protein [Proteobacteria bacterium]|nr:PEP-CTERM sorting domain-containing protein [Pseudomonadota bacterium]
MKYIKQKLQLAAVLAAMSLSGAAAAAPSPFSLLPTPENTPGASYQLRPDGMGNMREAIVYNGVAIAFKYDDFWSYSAKLLDAIQTKSPALLPTATYGTYDFSVGTGTIAVNLTSNAGGATNLNPNGSGVNFQDPADLTSNSTVMGWTCTWGGLTQSCTNYPVGGVSYTTQSSNVNGTSTVGNMLTYLHSMDPKASIPVIYADYNQAGSSDSLWFSAKVQIWDSTQNTLKAEWDLDQVKNSQLDVTSPTFNYGLASAYGNLADCLAAGAYSPTSQGGCAGITDNGDEYLKLDHNKGSGKPDFLAYSPDMDLNKFLSTDLIVITANLGCIQNQDKTWLVGAYPNQTPDAPKTTLGCNTNGGEEFGFIGAIARQDVPEPSSIVLAGLGLLGISRVRRARQS